MVWLKRVFGRMPASLGRGSSGGPRPKRASMQTSLLSFSDFFSDAEFRAIYTSSR
jgi:hypothetical protein